MLNVEFLQKPMRPTTTSNFPGLPFKIQMFIIGLKVLSYPWRTQEKTI